MRIRVAARGSRLSRIQVREAMRYLASKIPGLSYELVTVRTLGDRVRTRPLHEIRARGAFSGEVNRAVLEGRADAAVHSMKDLPSRLPSGLEILAVPPRAPPNDALVPRAGLPALPPWRLPQGSRVAAGSPRRRLMLEPLAPQARYTYIRGNIETRLRRLDEGRADYLVAAEAALWRMGAARPRYILPVPRFLPSPGQGLIAVVGPSDSSIARLLRGATHRRSHMEAEAERSLLARLSPGCGEPLGGLAEAGSRGVTVWAALYTRRGAVRAEARARDPREAGEEAAEALLGAAREVGLEWRALWRL